MRFRIFVVLLRGLLHLLHLLHLLLTLSEGYGGKSHQQKNLKGIHLVSGRDFSFSLLPFYTNFPDNKDWRVEGPERPVDASFVKIQGGVELIDPSLRLICARTRQRTPMIPFDTTCIFLALS